jgi:signal peptidase II
MSFATAPSFAVGPSPTTSPSPSPITTATPAASRRPPYWFLTAVAGTTLAIDTLSKLWAVLTLDTPDSTMSVIHGTLDFTLHRNEGGAFSMLRDAPDALRRPFFVIVSVLAIVAIVLAYKKLGEPRRWAARWGFALVLGGALGNFVDRIRDSSVVDFIHVHATIGGTHHDWPVFNIADVAIVLGAFALLLDVFVTRRTRTAKAPS